MRPIKSIGDLKALLGAAAPDAQISLEIDGQMVQAAPDTTVLEAADALGVWIPRLCHLPGVPARAVCQLCLVAIDGINGLVNACSTPVRAGMAVTTRSPQIDAVRRTLIEFTLLEHGRCGRPDCEVEALADRLGATGRPFETQRHNAAPPCGSDYLTFNPALCVLCDRCIRVCPLQVIGRSGRGAATVITFDGHASPADSRCHACGDCVAVCPSGALRAPDIRKPSE